MTPRVFFTYVWGPPGNPAWPLTFATKASRTHARRVLTEGDLVFTVGTRGEPTDPDYKGRVLGVFQVSDLEVNTQDYDLPRRSVIPQFDSVSRFPFALHPITAWQITSKNNVFSELVGPLTPNHHLQAQSKIVELEATNARPLLLLERGEIPPAMPKTEFGRGLVLRKNSKLAPKHKGSFSGSFGDHAIWYVYALVLRDERNRALAIKIGYSNAPEARVNAHNGSMAFEVTGLSWKLEVKQPTSSEDIARTIEQSTLSYFCKQRLSSNGEIIAGVEPLMVAAKIGTLMRGMIAPST